MEGVAYPPSASRLNLHPSLFISDVRIFQEWSRHRYGVFPERGFQGDVVYPERFEGEDGLWSENVGCGNLTSRPSQPIIGQSMAAPPIRGHVAQVKPFPPACPPPKAKSSGFPWRPFFHFLLLLLLLFSCRERPIRFTP